MTLRTSLFNKGIYKSVLKRFWWVMIVHLVSLLLIPTGYLKPLLTVTFDSRLDNYKQLIETMWCGSFCTIVFSMVMALLAYQSIHSKKQAEFIRSLPIKKEANFISSALAGFTLLAIPIIINGLVMLYCESNGIIDYYTTGFSFLWIGIVLLISFIAFSYATLASVLTGHGFAAFGLNVVIMWSLYYIPIIIDGLASNFLLGYEAQIKQIEDLSMHLDSWVIAIGCKLFAGENLRWMDEISAADFAGHIISALVLYAVSFVLYRRRKLEAAGEVAGFKIINPILKYGITLFAAMMTLYAFFSDTAKPAVIILAMVIVSAVVYFALEAAQKKSLRIWGSYKGYLCFAVVLTGFALLFACTSFFGYETRIPDVEDIESVALYDYDESTFNVSVPYVDNEEIKQFATELQNEIIEDNLMLSGPDYFLKMKYKLKNGDIISRKYMVERGVWFEAMIKCFEYEDYLQARFAMYTDESLSEGLDYIKVGNDIYLYGDDCDKYFECMYKDLSENYEYISQNVIGKMYDVTLYYNTGEYVVCDRINGTFTNTVAWLTEIGEWQKLK